MISCLRRGVLALLVVASLALPAAAQARFAPTALIVEGRSLGGVHLDDARAQVVRLWGPPDERCRVRPEWGGTVCQHLAHIEVTYDGTGHVAGITVFGLTNVTQPRVSGNVRRGVFATRAGIGPFVAQNTLIRHYGRRATLLGRRSFTDFGHVNRTWVVRGPAGRLTLFGVTGGSGGPNGGQITHVTVARERTPALTGPARLNLGTIAPVVADGLVPDLSYRVEATFPGASEPVPLATMRADSQGHAAANVAYDGDLAAALTGASTATEGDLAGSLRVVALDGDEPARSDDRRAFWLGPLVVSAPLAIAAPATTMTVEPSGPISFETALTVRFGGVLPTVLQGDQAPHIHYELVFREACGHAELHVFQEVVAGVVSLPGAADHFSPQGTVRFACGTLPAGQSVTVPLVLFRDVDLASGGTRRLVAAEVPLTFLRP